MKKILNGALRDFWVVLLDIVAVNASYYLAIMIRFFGNTISGIFNATKQQYMVA